MFLMLNKYRLSGDKSSVLVKLIQITCVIFTLLLILSQKTYPWKDVQACAKDLYKDEKSVLINAQRYDFFNQSFQKFGGFQWSFVVENTFKTFIKL